MVRPVAASARGWMTATRRAWSPTIAASSPSTPCPTTTSYGVRACTRMRVTSATRYLTRRHRGELPLDRVRDLLCRSLVGQHGDGRDLAVERPTGIQQSLELATY